MTDLKNYPLVFYRKVDQRKFHGKRAGSGQYVLVDSETLVKLPLSSGEVFRTYVSDKSNKGKRLRITKGNAA